MVDLANLHPDKWKRKIEADAVTDKHSIDDEAEWLSQLNQAPDVSEILGTGRPFYGGLDHFSKASLIEDYRAENTIDLRVTPAFTDVKIDNCQNPFKNPKVANDITDLRPTSVKNILNRTEVAMAKFRHVARVVALENQNIDNEVEYGHLILAKWKELGLIRAVGPLTPELLKPQRSRICKDHYMDFVIEVDEISGNGHNYFHGVKRIWWL